MEKFEIFKLRLCKGLFDGIIPVGGIKKTPEN